MIGNYVYIIGNRQKRVFKIGMSNNVTNRLKELKTGSPYLLEVILFIQCESPRVVEKELHTLFTIYRLNGEWFGLTNSVLREAIKTLKTYQVIEDTKTKKVKKPRERIKDRLARMLLEMQLE